MRKKREEVSGCNAKKLECHAGLQYQPEDVLGRPSSGPLPPNKKDCERNLKATWHLDEIPHKVVLCLFLIDHHGFSQVLAHKLLISLIDLFFFSRGRTIFTGVIQTIELFLKALLIAA